jgi:hypothetical protein
MINREFKHDITIACFIFMPGLLTLPAAAQDAATTLPRPRMVINCGGGGWKEGQVQEPCILVNPKDPSKLIMFYAGMTLGGKQGALAKAWASVSDPFTWHEDADNPILGGVRPDPLDRSGFIRLGSVIYQEALDEYWIYYSGTCATVPGVALFLATCPAGKDGYSGVVKANIKCYADNPVLSPGGQGRTDENFVGEGAVLRENGLWYLCYSYRTANKVLPGYRLATSHDGKHWTKSAGPDILAAAPESRYCEWHQLCKIGNLYVLLYEGYNGGTRWGADVATSSSLTTGWKKLPVKLIDQTKWPGYRDETQFHVATPAMYRINDRWYMYFDGAGGEGEYGWQHWAMWCIRCDDLVKKIMSPAR